MEDVYSKEQITALVEEFEYNEGLKSNFMQLWQDISDYVMPRKAFFTQTGSNPQRQVNTNLYDGTAIWANEQLASGLHSYLTPSTERWLRWQPKDLNLGEEIEVKEWLEHATDRFFQVISSEKTNFTPQIHEMWLDSGAFGTSPMMVEESFDYNAPPLYFCTYHLSQCVIQESKFGRVDYFGRRFSISPRLAKQYYGDHPKIMEALNSKSRQDMEFVQIIKPRDEFDPTKRDSRNMPYESVHILMKTKEVVRTGGYREFPLAIPRFSKITGEVYGRSPAMTCLPDIKMVNAMAKTILKAGQKAVDPPMMLPDEGFLLPIKMSPGGMNFYNNSLDENQRIQTLDIKANIPLGLDLLDSRREHILRTFYLDWMQMNEGTEMTATEVMQRTEDRMRMMAPATGRLTAEGLVPLCERIFGILYRRGIIRPAPDILRERGGDIYPEFISPVAKVQKRTQAMGLARVIEIITPLMNVKPDLADKFASDGIVDDLADMFDLPSTMVNNRDEVDALRQARADAAKAENDAMQAKTESETMANQAKAMQAMGSPQLQAIQGGKSA